MIIGYNTLGNGRKKRRVIESRVKKDKIGNVKDEGNRCRVFRILVLNCQFAIFAAFNAIAIILYMTVGMEGGYFDQQ